MRPCPECLNMAFTCERTPEHAMKALLGGGRGLDLRAFTWAWKFKAGIGNWLASRFPIQLYIFSGSAGRGLHPRRVSTPAFA